MGVRCSQFGGSVFGVRACGSHSLEQPNREHRTANRELPNLSKNIPGSLVVFGKGAFFTPGRKATICKVCCGQKKGEKKIALFFLLLKCSIFAIALRK